METGETVVIVKYLWKFYHLIALSYLKEIFLLFSLDYVEGGSKIQITTEGNQIAEL